MTLTAVLFAGGESRRMGTDKATLAFAARPLWARQLAVLRCLNPARLLVSARTKPAWCPPDITTVLDATPSRGPLSGLVAALGRVETTHLLALAVDLPLMTIQHMEKLWSLARPGCGVAPTRKGGLEPLCAIYPAESLAAARGALNGANVSLHHLIRTLAERSQIELHVVDGADATLYRNLNTPSDLDSAVRGDRIRSVSTVGA